MSLAMAQSFALFAELPAELRLLVWENTLQPRIIPLQCQIQCALNTPGTFLYHSFLQPPTDRGRTRELPSSVVDIRVHFAAASTIESASILQVCRESRQFAVRHGYRVWKLKDEFGKTRDVMWNAALDTVSFATPHRASIPRFYGELFRRQFPVEVKQVRTVAIPVTSWKSKHREKVELGECWVGYSNMRTIIVVLEDAFQPQGTNMVDNDTCDLILGIRRGLEKSAARFPAAKWKVPSLLLVPNEKDIPRAEDVEIRLECDSCESSDVGCQVVPVHTKVSI